MRSADTARSRKDQDVVVGEHRSGRLAADAVDGLSSPAGAFCGRAKCSRSWRCGNAPSSSSLKWRGSSRDPHWSAPADVTSSRLCDARIAAEQVGPRPDDRDQRGHQLFADRHRAAGWSPARSSGGNSCRAAAAASRARRSACRCPSSRPGSSPRFAIGSRKNWMSSCV